MGLFVEGVDDYYLCVVVEYWLLFVVGGCFEGQQWQVQVVLGYLVQVLLWYVGGDLWVVIGDQFGYGDVG